MNSKNPRNPLFSAPIDDAVEVESASWGELNVTLGQRIQFQATIWAAHISHEERLEGVIEELWEEQWHGQTLLYAEVIIDDGTARRAWFHRDHVTLANGLTGKVLENALW